MPACLRYFVTDEMEKHILQKLRLKGGQPSARYRLNMTESFFELISQKTHLAPVVVAVIVVAGFAVVGCVHGCMASIVAATFHFFP